MKSFDIVTIFYRREIEQLLLQLRSIGKFLPAGLINSIVVIWNDEPLLPSSAKKFTALFAEQAGGLFPKIQLLQAADIVADNAAFEAGAGWRTQQVLKLMVADHVASAFYCCLDAKNHFIAPCTAEDFFEADGRPKTTLVNRATNDAAFFQRSRSSLNYFRVEGDVTLPTVTPMVMIREKVKDMIEAVEAREGTDFATAFLEGEALTDVTEFLLYSAFIQSQGEIERLYVDRPKIYSTFFATAPNSDGSVKREMRRIESGEAKILGVHSKRKRRQTPLERDFFIDLWVKRGLVENRDDAARLLRISPSRVLYERITEQRDEDSDAILIGKSELDGPLLASLRDPG